MVQIKNKNRLLKLRDEINKKRPSFRRVESWRYKRVKDSWRKARGIDSKTREKRKSGVKSPSAGYRGPKKVRGLHPSGYEEVKVIQIKELENLDNKKQAIKISSKLGAKKRMNLINVAQKNGFKILNLGISQKEIEQLESQLETSINGLDEDDLLDLDDLDDSLDVEGLNNEE